MGTWSNRTLAIDTIVSMMFIGSAQIRRMICHADGGGSTGIRLGPVAFELTGGLEPR
ncbi:MAG: hypothetical protein V9E98_11975 [Candidatus Nanopelagicales bacterium]